MVKKEFTLSLKAFHIIFIVAATLLAFGFGGWLIYYHIENSSYTFLFLGLIHLIAGVGLIAYGKRFLQKLKHVSYM